MISKPILLSSLLGIFTLATTTGCGSWWLPKAHKIEIQQGNLLPAASVAKVVEGMSKTEVMSLLGEPVITNSFDSQRWDYIYSLNRSGESPDTKRLTLFFENNQIVVIEKDGLS